MWSRINIFLIVSMIKSHLGDITVSREDSGDKFISNYKCHFYNAVSTLNQNECLCRINGDNGTLILLNDGSIICHYETKPFAGKTYFYLHQTIQKNFKAFFLQLQIKFLKSSGKILLKI